MSNDISVVEDGFRGDVIARSASVPMVAEEKIVQPVSKEIPNIDHLKPLDIANSRIRRFSSGSMIMSVSSPKLSRLSPARLEQIKYEELDAFVMQEIAHERATCSNLAACSNLAQLMTKDWSMCDNETSSDASSSTESSSVAAASSLSSGIGGIQSSGGVSPTVAKFPSPLSVLSPSPPPYSFSASSVPGRIRAANRCHKRSQSPKVAPAFTFSSSANASPASSTASGGAYSPTTLTPSLLRPSSLRGLATKRRFDGPSLFYHHTTPSAAIGTGVAASSSDPDSPLTFRKSRLLVQATTCSSTIAQSAQKQEQPQQQKEETSEECHPAKIKRPSSFVSDVNSSSMSENESGCSTPASSTPQSQISLLAVKEAQNQPVAAGPAPEQQQVDSASPSLGDGV